MSDIGDRVAHITNHCVQVLQRITAPERKGTSSSPRIFVRTWNTSWAKALVEMRSSELWRKCGTRRALLSPSAADAEGV